MPSKSINLEVIFICLLAFIPWPIPNSVTIQCSRENSQIVRRIVKTKLTPIFQKYNYELPLECPFHPERDLFAPQESAKVKNRPTQWQCGFCGKSFYEERFLDLHFDSRHRTIVNEAEDAICMSDFCDIMRCDVLVSKDSTMGSFSQSSTDIELYNEATALATAQREVINSNMDSKAFNNLPPSIRDKLSDLLSARGEKIPETSQNSKIVKRRLRNVCKRKVDSNNNNENDDSNGENSTSNQGPCDPSESHRPFRMSEMQRRKANCKSDEILKMRTRCERIIRTCISGALSKLEVEEFKAMEEEMNKAICWYLTCDRYWEDASAQRPFPWALVFILVVVLSLGICLCYYIIWVLFDSNDDPFTTSSSSSYNFMSAASVHHHSMMPTTSITSSSSIPLGMSTSAMYQHLHHHNQPTVIQTSLSHGHQPLDQLAYTEEIYPPTAGIDEQYIYVTYPSEMKPLKYSDSFYNRTSRI